MPKVEIISTVLDKIRHFLSANWDGRSPLLLGYSGGPDSKALLYGLLEAGCRAIHLAHADHGWRAESAEEAETLRNEAANLGVPFHSASLHLPPGNKEAVSRNARLAFFRSLFEKIPFQALLLAHHAGDAAETALKRALEGANLPFLGGMAPVSSIEGMAVWRPLLSEKKEALSRFLLERKLAPLIDPTNFDPAYLRARMRLEILPQLSKIFGKEAGENLALLGQRAVELRDYLEMRTGGRTLRPGPWGRFGSVEGLERIEARYLLQKWAAAEKISMPRGILEPALDALLSKRPNCKISRRVTLDRGRIFFLSESSPSPGALPLTLAEGDWEWGGWRIRVRKACGEERQCGWEEVWSGSFSILVPEGSLEMPRAGTSLRHDWNAAKVPAFFRGLAPIIRTASGKEREFLTGKRWTLSEPAYTLIISTRCIPN